MGLYDVIDDVTVYCPQCGKQITDQFQTKSFVYMGLDHYKIGNKIPETGNNHDWIEIHAICDNCDLFVSVNLKVINGILTDKFY